MRSGLVAIAVVAACGDNIPVRQDAAAVHDAVPDAPFTCAVSGTCTTGPMCGATCCGEGEHCVAGACLCGNQPACTNGDTCQGAGFAVGFCGSVCCGGTVGCPINVR